MCSYIYWAREAELELYFTPSEEDYNYCQAFGDSDLYTVSYGLSELWKLASYEFI